MSTRHVFVTGATGYLGRALVPALQARGHTVRALVRPGSERRLPAGVAFVHGDALDAASYAAHVAPADTLVQLVGVPHPSPSKAPAFERVDRVSGLAAVAAARAAGVRHLVYVSVAQPAPVMRAYVAVRAAVEAEIRAAVSDESHALPGATVLRPMYALLRQLPSTRDGAVRLGLVTYADMIAALVHAVEAPAAGVRVVDVPAIRGAGKMHKVLV